MSRVWERLSDWRDQRSMDGIDLMAPVVLVIGGLVLALAVGAVAVALVAGPQTLSRGVAAAASGPPPTGVPTQAALVGVPSEVPTEGSSVVVALTPTRAPEAATPSAVPTTPPTSVPTVAPTAVPTAPA
ncbi:MAG: hypothetical protein JOZ87_02445, partial [Chloroflexi bacterium]|nr:hypothetical protein [Chloroflexota bacterium]